MSECRQGADADRGPTPPEETCSRSDSAALESGESYTMSALDPTEYDRWDEFVLSSPHGTLFHCAWWYRAWGLDPLVKVLVAPDGRIQGGICYAVGRRFGTRAILRPPLTPRNGPVFRRLDKPNRHAQATREKKMILAAIHALPMLGAYDFLLCPCDADVLPFLWNGFDPLVGYTYVIRQAERQTWLQHASTTQRRRRRQATRQAAEEHWTVEENPPWEEVLALLQETAAFKQYTIPTRRLCAWWQVVAAREAGQAYLLRDGQGQAASASLMVQDNHCAYYLAGGMRRDLRKGSILNVLLMHRMIERALNQGLDFDFEGSVVPSVEKFFRSFGGELCPMYRVVKFPSPVAYLVWHGYRFLTLHRKRRWAWYE